MDDTERWDWFVMFKWANQPSSSESIVRTFVGTTEEALGSRLFDGIVEPGWSRFDLLIRRKRPWEHWYRTYDLPADFEERRQRYLDGL